MPEAGDPLDRLVTAVLAGPKYRWVSADLIRSIGARELWKRRPLKEAIKATKNTLHQVGGAYQEGRIDYAAGLDALRKAAGSEDDAEWQAACARLMSHHASTRERLVILDRFHSTVLADIGPIRSVLDLACGLHPLSIPWMPLATDAEYYAYDVYEDMTDFLNEFLALARCRGRAEVVDVTRLRSTPKVDVAFILKSLPCLEQLDSGAALRLLDTVQADHLLISFPVHSLGGKSKEMADHYEARFRELVAGRNWLVARFEFATELAFRVTCDAEREPIRRKREAAKVSESAKPDR
jgi:16S rRNA (guanine(1405)-N(7))-methyltransferase